MKYKQIVEYPLYYIDSNGTSVLKLCKTEYYKKIGDNIFRRKKITSEYDIQMPSEKYVEIDGLIYRILKILENKCGYKFVKLTNDSGKRTLYMHRLVYTTYVGSIPSNMEVNHIDHNKSDNCVVNLELVTHSENMRKAVLHYGNKLVPRCKECGNKIYSKNPNAIYCYKCAKTYDTSFYAYTRKYKYEHPSKEVLWELIKSKSFVELGRMFGVTDKAIRKLAKSSNLPFRKKDIKLQMQKEI